MTSPSWTSLADTVHVAYGKPAVFGIVTQPKGVRVGINQYLGGVPRRGEHALPRLPGRL